MNVNIAKTYFDKNGFIFVIVHHTEKWRGNTQIVSIARYTDFDEAYLYFKRYDNAEFANITQAKQRGWIDNDN